GRSCAAPRGDAGAGSSAGAVLGEGGRRTGRPCAPPGGGAGAFAPPQPRLPAAGGAAGPPAMGVVCTTAFRRASMRETDDAYSFAAQTERPLTASATGALPTEIAGPAVPDAGSILETVLSRLFATQTALSPTAIAAGPSPTWLVPRSAPECGSTSSRSPCS